MADDRMHVRCKMCGERLVLFKELAGEVWMKFDTEEVEKFMNAHRWCIRGDGTPTTLRSVFETEYEK